jgi:hypothetical protein
MSFRFKDLTLHIVAFADRQPGICDPCTATAPAEKVPKPKPRPECAQASQKPPRQQPAKDRPAKRSALDLLRLQLRMELG